MHYKIIRSFLPLLFLFLANCTGQPEVVEENPQTHIIKESSYQDIQNAFLLLNYQIDQLDEGAPPVVIQRIPDNINHIEDVESRKRMFFKIMLPLILLVNQEIHSERQQILDLEEQFHASAELSSEQILQLEAIALRYRFELDPADLSTAFEVLRRRVDTIPVDLALAQAANESGWGTSRFTRVANNLFGEWTFIQGNGVVPKNRPEGEVYEVKKFPTIYDSVRSYANNLNSHTAYRDFRRMRAQHRNDATMASGLVLAEGLLSYSIRGEDYVQEIQSMIRHNKLERLANVGLR